VKIKDITEGLYDTLTKYGQSKKQAQWAAGGADKFYGNERDQRAQAQAAADKAKADAAAASAEAALDAAAASGKLRDPREDLLGDDLQMIFPNTELPGINVIVRQEGFFFDRLPANLRSQVRRDPKTRLYPVLKADNIERLTAMYDKARAAKKVITKPIAAL
jgi:carboxylesterase type B